MFKDVVDREFSLMAAIRKEIKKQEVYVGENVLFIAIDSIITCFPMPAFVVSIQKKRSYSDEGSRHTNLFTLDSIFEICYT
jgi:hypothetical protein